MATVVIAASNPTPATAAAGLAPRCLWHLDESTSTAQSTTATNTGSESGCVMQYQSARAGFSPILRGNAYSAFFDGTGVDTTGLGNHHLYVGLYHTSGTTPLNYSAADPLRSCSVACWFVMGRSIQPGYTMTLVGNYRNNHTGAEFGIGADGKLAATMGTGSATVTMSGGAVLIPGRRYHACLVIESDGDAALYLNGTSVDTETGTITNGWTSSPNNFAIGVRQNSNTATRFFGWIGTVATYDSALTSVQVAGLYSPLATDAWVDCPVRELYPDMFGAAGDALYAAPGSATDDTTALNRWIESGIRNGLPCRWEPNKVYRTTKPLVCTKPLSTQVHSGFVLEGPGFAYRSTMDQDVDDGYTAGVNGPALDNLNSAPAIYFDSTTTVSTTFTANTSTDQITLAAAIDTLYDYTPVLFTTTGTLPAPLLPSVYYYLQGGTDTASPYTVYTRTAAATFAAVDITSTGSGTHTVSRYRAAVELRGLTNFKVGGFAILSDISGANRCERGIQLVSIGGSGGVGSIRDMGFTGVNHAIYCGDGANHEFFNCADINIQNIVAKGNSYGLTVTNQQGVNYYVEQFVSDGIPFNFVRGGNLSANLISTYDSAGPILQLGYQGSSNGHFSIRDLRCDGSAARTVLLNTVAVPQEGYLTSVGTAVTTSYAHGLFAGQVVRLTSGAQSGEERTITAAPTTTTLTISSAFSADQTTGVAWAFTSPWNDVTVLFDNVNILSANPTGAAHRLNVKGLNQVTVRGYRTPTSAGVNSDTGTGGGYFASVAGYSAGVHAFLLVEESKVQSTPSTMLSGGAATNGTVRWRNNTVNQTGVIITDS